MPNDTSQPSVAVQPPLIALVGRPNVGKSTLFNRLTGHRTALVDDRPGVTRDRLFGRVEYGGREARIVDTGGFDSDPDDPLLGRMREQTQLAIDEADLVLLVLDSQDGLRPADAEVVQLLRRSGTATVAVVNKIDEGVHDDRISDFYELGLDPMFAVSAEHGRGIEDLWEHLDSQLQMPLVEDASEASRPVPVREDEPEGISTVEWEGGPIRVAVVGRPNVGKSTLINRLLGEERMVATDIAGTTRDPVDSRVTHDGQEFVFVDTAGIRRRRSIADRLEKFAVMAAMRSIERCDVAVIVLDGVERPSDQDARIAAMAHENGKGVVIVANKWDLPDNTEWRVQFPKAVTLDLNFVRYANLVRLSAKTGKGVHKLFEPIIDAQRERHRRVATGELNRFFRDVIERTGPARYKGKRAHLFFVSQPLVRPPTFIFAARNPNNIPNAYARYLRNELRDRYGFAGTPIWLKFRPRGKNKGQKGKSLDK